MTSRLEARVVRAIEEWLVKKTLVIRPRKPTKAMIKAGAAELDVTWGYHDPDNEIAKKQARKSWRAMNKTAPAPDTQSLAATMIKVFTEVYDDDGKEAGK